MYLPGALGAPIYSFYHLIWTALDWIYPPMCGGCGTAGSRLCPTCINQIQLVSKSFCLYCGDALPSAGICVQCQKDPPPYRAARSWAIFNGPIRNSLHRLKYQGDIALGEILARPLIEMLKSLCWKIDVVTAVPLGVARRKERGYNQSALLAIPLSLGSSKTFESRALYRTRETRSQVGLTWKQRHENVAEAFHARSNYVKGKSVLVVDDVATSGATLRACTEALLEVGALEVYCLTLARAGFDSL